MVSVEPPYMIFGNVDHGHTYRLKLQRLSRKGVGSSEPKWNGSY